MMLFLPFAQAQTVTTVYSFNASSGSPVTVIPVQNRNGGLYGALYEPSGTAGSVFEITTSGRETQPYTFSNGESSYVAPALGTDGYLYGTTYDGGDAGNGTLFKLSPTGVYTDLHDFQGGSDGANPYTAPILASDGNFYGTTYGTSGASTVYRYEPNGTFTTICNLTSSQGTEVLAPLVQGTDGNLYGTAFTGGNNDDGGSIFEISTAGQVLWTYEFPSFSGGANPGGPLVQASDGNFYGTTAYGGSSGNYGTIFMLDQAGNVTILHDFNYDDGANVFSGLTQGTDGRLYGAAYSGGVNDGGTLFSIGIPGPFTTLYHFGAQGESPYAAPMQDTNGVFYGTTYAGGKYGYGTLYSLNMGLGPFITFVQPTGIIGQSAQILGQNLTGATSVTFNGVPATSFSVKSSTYMTAVVPAGATTGPVVVTTPTGTLTSNKNFLINEN
jgi:uncharacterized repeat protein (TIGR03803 family)